MGKIRFSEDTNYHKDGSGGSILPRISGINSAFFPPDRHTCRGNYAYSIEH